MYKVFENVWSFEKYLHFTNRFWKLHMKITNLQHQILVCELHQNAFGSRAMPGAAGVAIALPQTP